MKLHKIFAIVVLVILSVTSCKKALDLAPEDYFGENNFWQNETQVNNFIVGMHNQMRSYQFMLMRLGELRGGGFSSMPIMPVSLNETPIIDQSLSEDAPGIYNWGNLYSNFGPIFQCNLAIYYIDKTTFLSEEKKKYYLAQVHGLRAFYYFHLLRTYGGVPLRLIPDVVTGTVDPVALRLARSTEAETLTAIKDDITISLTYFGAEASDNKYIWSPNASRMLKGEIYLWSAKVYNNTADLAEAKSALEAVTGYSLLPDFKNVFKQKANSEIIMAIRYAVGEAEMPVATFTYDLGSFNNQYYKDSAASGSLLSDPLDIAATNSQQIIQRYRYTFDLFKAYNPVDTRRDATFYDFYKVDVSKSPKVVLSRNTVLKKFIGEISANKRYFSDDWPVYREADRLLMLAEIANAQGADPTQYIKPIRDRAFANADPAPFVNASKDKNEVAIFEERIKEFVFEGKRWYDIRRMKYGGDPLAFKSGNHPYGVLDKGSEAYKLLWPIDKTIWTDDPLVNQTPGYSTSKP